MFKKINFCNTWIAIVSLFLFVACQTGYSPVGTYKKGAETEPNNFQTKNLRTSVYFGQDLKERDMYYVNVTFHNDSGSSKIDIDSLSLNIMDYESGQNTFTLMEINTTEQSSSELHPHIRILNQYPVHFSLVETSTYGLNFKYKSFKANKTIKKVRLNLAGNVEDDSGKELLMHTFVFKRSKSLRLSH